MVVNWNVTVWLCISTIIRTSNSTSTNAGVSMVVNWNVTVWLCISLPRIVII